MKQLFTRIFAKVAMVACLATAFAGSVLAQKVTDYSNIVSGTQYYIGATTGGSDYYLSVDGSTLTQSIAGTAVTSKDSATPLEFSGSGTSWTIQFDSGYYLSLKSSKDNGKVQVVENAATFTASNQSGKIRLTINGYSVQKNNSGTQFGSYANTQTDIWLEPVSGGSTSTTYTVTYDSNGGSGTMTDPNSPYNAGASVSVLNNTFTYSDHTFSKWNTAADGSGTNYKGGDTFTINANTTLYAQWTQNSTGGSSATLTAANLELTGSYTTDTEKTIGGIKYVFTDLMKNNDNIQAKASTGTIKNSTAFPGDITSVAITHSGTARATTINGSADGTTWTQVATGDGSITADFSGKGYKFFQITRGSNAAYWEKIVVSYSTGSSSLTASDLAITNASTDLAFDLYNNTTAQVINYTTSSTGTITITPASPTTYFSYVHDASQKTITVTPLAITPSAQTITISQAADESYYAGAATFTVSIADSTPLANIAALTANTASGTYSVALSDAVVTYVNGNYAYIQDASGAVVMYKSEHGFAAGDVLNSSAASVTYQLHNGNPQITGLTGAQKTTGAAPSPTSVVAADWNFTFSNVLSQYFQITGATITSNNNKYYVSLGGEDIQLYKSGTALSGLDLTKTYTIVGFPTLYVSGNNTTKELQVFEAPAAEVSTTPSISVTPVTITELDYVEGNGPSAAKSFTVSGENLTADISLSLGGSDFEMSLSENDTYTNSLTITQTSGTVSETTVYVRLKAGKTIGNYSGTITLSSTNADSRTVDISGNVTAPEAPNVTWDLTTNDYAAASASQVSWTSSYVNMTLDKEGSTTNANNYLGGSSNDHTRFYKDQELSFTPISGYEINSIEITAVTSYVAGFTGHDWTNGTASTSGTKITITPTDGGQEVSVVISTACRATAVKVYYSVSSTPSIVVSPATVEKLASDVEGTLDIDYQNLTISDMTDFDVEFFDANENPLASEAEPDWIAVDVAEQDPSIGSGYVVSFIMNVNTGAERTAYFKVFAAGATDLVYSNLVTITQAAYVAPGTSDDYHLFTGNLVEGDYIIYYNGKAMNPAVNNNRLQYEEVTPTNDVINTGDETIVWHIAPSGEYWTIYNAAVKKYAASTGAAKKAQMLEDGTDAQALWTITDAGNGTYEFVNKQNTENDESATLRNNGEYGFACYATSTGGPLTLYKFQNNPTPISITATLFEGRYWATFFNGTARYRLPAGAQAFTMDSEHKLYMVGNDGSEIPAGVAVIIIADHQDLELTNVPSAIAVEIHGSGNILTGSDTPVDKTGSQYVLGIVNGVMKFYLFNGTAIKAGKAYYE